MFTLIEIPHKKHVLLENESCNIASNADKHHRIFCPEKLTTEQN